MRSLGANLLTAQATHNREPGNAVVVRDVMLRFSQFTGSAVATNFPAATVNNIPQCPIDIGTYHSGYLWRVWMHASAGMYVHRVNAPDTAASWQDAFDLDTFAYGGNNPDKQHRATVSSADGGLIFYGCSGAIRSMALTGGSLQASTEFRAAAYTADTDHIALAAVSGSVIYMLVFHDNVDFKYLSLHRVTSGGVTDCPHTIIVDGDYTKASLTWFDAETKGSKDVIVFSERAHGQPVSVFYEDGVWSDPRPIMPMDVVCTYSFVRVAALNLIEGTLFATGRLGLKGSTGNHAQAVDIVLRSKDGEHWAFDRYCYVCADNQRGKFVTTGTTSDGYIYYANGAEVKRARWAHLAGGDPSDKKWTLTTDVLSWGYEQPPPGTACAGQTVIADHDGDWSSVLSPGYWLWRSAGWNSYIEQMSVEGIDRLPTGYQAGNRTLTLHTRDIVLRQMRDWSSAWDWQWLSQNKHWDDCDLLDYLYSISAAQIDVPSTTDAELTGHIDQSDLIQGDALGLEFTALNRPGIFLSTTPFDVRNFSVAGRFTIDSGIVADDLSPGLGLLQNNLTLDSKQGSISYSGASDFDDDGQDFSDWRMNTGLEARYMIQVTNTDGTITWAYLVDPAVGDVTKTSVAKSITCGDAGWNGAGISGKTPSTYWVGKIPARQRIGTGFGAIGCVDSDCALVAAFYDVVEGYLYLLQRSEESNDDVWLVLGRTQITLDEKNTYMYEVALQRDGRRLTARAFYFHPVTFARTDLATITYDWALHETMIETDADRHDFCHVGVITNLNVYETHMMHYSATTVHAARAIENWPEPPNGYDDNAFYDTADKDEFHYSVEDNYNDIDVTLDLVIETEESPVSFLTQSNMRSHYFTLESHTDSPNTATATDDCAPEAGKSWHDSGNGYGWVFVIVEGGGVSNLVSGEVTGSSNAGGKDTFTVDVSDEDWALLVNGETKFILLPGVKLVRPGWDTGDTQAHGTGALARVHEDPSIQIRRVLACDGDFDKDLEWVLKDIAAKAGVLDFTVADSISETFTPPDVAAAPRWLDDIDSVNVRQRDFDITVTVPTAPLTNDYLTVVARALTELATSTTGSAGNIGSWSAVRITYGLDASDHPYVRLEQTSASGSNADTWVEIDEITLDDSLAGGKRIRFVGRENFFTVYVNDCFAATMHAGATFGAVTDGYDTDIDGRGYIGVFCGGSPSWASTTAVQNELWAWTDGIILDQRMNAVAGLQRAIRDRRVKYQGTSTGALKISVFKARDDVGTIGDHIYRDTAGPTDHVATHVRVVGEEISDYIDHTNAALFGLMFSLAQCPSLDEEEAYAEAQRLAEDAVSLAGARQSSIAARLEWESEDELDVAYTPADGGPSIADDYIVVSVKFAFKPGDLSMAATLREKP